MLDKDMLPISGDDAGNNMKWDSLVLDSKLYLKNGNYALFRDTTMKQAQFVEAEGKPRIAIAYYLMVFYSDLNGFDSIDRMLAIKRSGFKDWKSKAAVDSGIVNKIFSLVRSCDVTNDDMKEFIHRAFVPGIYQCHLFTIDESKEILYLARDGAITEIRSRITEAEKRFIKDFS